MGTSHLYNFTSQQITRFKESAENKFTIERGSIIDRESIALVAGQELYTVPDYVQQFRRVTYLGWKVWPLDQRSLRNSYLSGTQQSRPYWYVFNNVPNATGAGFQFKLFPVPSLDIPLIASYTDLWGPGIINGFVIEYFRAPDFTGTKNRVPAYFMDSLSNMYANKRCFAIDGPGQSLKGVDFWAQKWHELKGAMIENMDDLNNKPRNIVATDAAQRPYGFTPPPPILPIDRYGISVDEPGW